MIKPFVRRHRLVAIPLVMAMGGITLPYNPMLSGDIDATLPTQVIVQDATVIDQGVQISWLAAKAGTHPVDSYVLEKDKNGKFVQLAKVEDFSLKYVDDKGKAGDRYRIIAEDNQQPAKRSIASEVVTAAPDSPGNNYVLSRPPAHYSKAMKSVDQADTPEAKAAILKTLLGQEFTKLDHVLKRKDVPAIDSHLSALQAYQNQLLGLLPHLSRDHKVSVSQVCTDHRKALEANLHLLTEQNRMNGLLVDAGCDAIEEAVQ